MKAKGSRRSMLESQPVRYPKGAEKAMVEAMTIWANEELCIVPSNQVEYADPVQGAFAAQYEDGGYKVVADYNTGNKGDLTGQAFVDYCLSDTMTADELETQVEEITARTIADAEE